MTARNALMRSRGELEACGVPSPSVDAPLLLCKSLGISQSELYRTLERRLDHRERDRLREAVERRKRREPLGYILGEWGFRRLTLAVDPRVLLPRPETEVVVERCLALVVPVAEPEILDVGTGSGAIALALADEHRGARVLGIDTSARALALADENARRLGLPVRFVRHDLWHGLPRGRYDLVVSNPPYVGEDELSALEPEVRDWEPREALLDRGQTLAVVRAARDVLKPGGWLVLETHGHRAADVARAATENGYGPPRITNDLAGRERVVEAQWQL
jgi:release factor glutamine methyltransferase